MIIGHTHNIEKLKALADENQLSHGYLFFGPERVGKKYLATALAGYLETQQFEVGARLLSDMLLVAPRGKATIGIDEARRVRSFLWQRPQQSLRRVVIVDDAHLLTEEAQNALLKLAEEPPASGCLMLVTSDPDALAPTLRSRLQAIYFGAVSSKEIASWLQREEALPLKEAEALAQKVYGAPGLAWALLHDAALQHAVAQAEKFLHAADATRKEVLKKMMEPEDFRLTDFLDALILSSLMEKNLLAKTRFWHRLLALRKNAAYATLNPRLQLESLMVDY